MGRSGISRQSIDSPQKLISSKTITQVLFHLSGWVVGSLEILGSPASLVRSIGNGVSDFFRLPYEGLTRGPGAFVAGVSRGTTSFVKHISKGETKTDVFLHVCTENSVEQLQVETAGASPLSRGKEESSHQQIPSFNHVLISHQSF